MYALRQRGGQEPFAAGDRSNREPPRLNAGVGRKWRTVMSMITFTIREASVEDAAAASILVTELGYPTQAAEMRERLVGLLVDATYSAFVAESDGALLGLAGCHVGRYFEKNGLYAQVAILVVAADAHGRGGLAAHSSVRWRHGRPRRARWRSPSTVGTIGIRRTASTSVAGFGGLGFGSSRR